MDDILYIPLDERPCNYDFPIKLINSTKGFKLLIPPKEMLGKKKTPSNFVLLKNYILENVKSCKAAVISIDQILYGGIVPSRLHKKSLKTLNERLDLIKEIKTINPNIILNCFVLIMRCPNYSSSDEEPDYYEYYGETINKIGRAIDLNEDYKALIGDNEEIIKAYVDYTQRRRKNIKLIKNTIRLTKDTIDYLIIPQDDSQVHGFSSMDRAEVLEFINEGKYKNIDLYPGADEIGMTLISRSINELKGSSKSIYIDFLHEESKTLIPAYENREVFETIKAHIKASGNSVSESVKDSDVVLFLNYDKDVQKESFEPSKVDEDNALKQISRMKDAKKKGKIIALADACFVNGGNIEYMKILSSKMKIDSLDVYAGWNTSSNTLGTAISFATALSYESNVEESKKFLAERIYDDLIYQAYARSYITKNILPGLGLNYFDVKKGLSKVRNITKKTLKEFAKENFKSFYTKHHLKDVNMPWKRMFEISVEVDK